MAGHEWEDWFEREEFIGQISDMRVQNLQVERELVQKRTFTRWMNLHLEKCEPAIEVHDLFQDIQDGHILMALLEELSGCKLLHGFKKSSHRIFRLNNIAKVLSFLEERNVKLVSIDAADVADGNSSIILGLIWNIILFFQIKELTGNIRSQFPSSSSLSSIPTSSDSDTSLCSTPSDHRQTAASAMREQSKAIKKLLQWLQKRTRKYGVAVQDFGKSWTSGLAFLAVIKSIDPSLVDMRKALLRTARENLEDAFRIAHYSLGIPRLLEPEDVTINPPEEQSIIIYVSQFLEHFPEEPEEPSHLIERSISMCRLNYRDSDSDHMRNSSPRSLVSERSYRFQRDCAKPPPKILISSVSEDRSAMSPPYRAVAARSWSVEDFLADSSHMDDFSSSEQPNEPSREVHTDSNADSPQLSYTHSPSGSSGPESFNAESVIGDSAISSPDSWMDSEFGVMPERFSESRSDSSLCDSGTAWEDVYRATPVEIMTLDEGFVPSIEDKAPDGQSITESFIDEGIYSLGSLESAQERIQGHSDEKNVKEVQEKEDNLEMNNKSMAFEQVPDQNETEITEEVDKLDISLQQKGEVDREQEASFGMCDSKVLDNSDLLETEQSPAISNNEQPENDHFEELLKQSSVQERAYGELKCLEKVVNLMGEAQDHEGQMNGPSESEDGGKGWEEVEGKTECTKTDLEETKWESREESVISKDGDEDEVETQDNDTEGVPKDCLDPKESSSSETWGVSVETNPTDQDVASKTSLDPRPGINIPLISIWLEPEEPDEEQTYEPEGQWEKNEVNRAEATGKKGTDTDGESPQNPGELSRDSNKSDDINLVEIPSCLVTENGDTTTSEQTSDIESRHLDDTGKQEVGRSSNVDIRGTDTIDDVEKSEAKQEGVDNKCQTANTEKDLVAQSSSSTDDTTQPLNKEQEMDITEQLDGDQDKLGETFSYNETANTQQQNTSDPVNSKPNGGAGIWSGCVPRDMDYFSTDFDGRSLGDDLVGDLEPMDLFYPDKEQLMFTEPPDAEMQSWPSVLSVSALQPAPASDEQLLNLLDEDFTNGVDWIRENNKMIKESDQETAGASESQEQCLLPGEKMGGLLGGDPADGSEAEQWSSDCARENTGPVRSDSRAEEKQTAPVLRHRKGARSINSTDNQTAGTEASRNLDNADSDVWELYLLLLMWLLLYCFWLLPQMDLKTLPSMLLNRKH